MGAVATQPIPDSIGRYEVLGRLAMGGMAEILLGRLRGPSGFERAVVIKRILPHLAGVQAFVDMFLDEARIAARIAHPNVVQVHELGRSEDDLYIVMEYIEGESVAGLMRRALARRMTMPPLLAAHVCAQTCAGLHAAHELRGADGAPQDLVHRDVSPHNLIVTYDGVVKIVDFGIAKAADRIAKTEAGVLKGKFDYMSPEQADGMPLDRRSDLFSLGTVLYEVSTGHRLFKRESATMTLRAVSRGHVPPPSSLVPDYPPHLEAVCLRALARHPDDRYATAAEMRRDLVGVMRRLEGDALPEEALARFLHELFPDRIEEKRRMLEDVRAGTALTAIPVAEADTEVELPLVDNAIVDRTATSHVARRMAPRRAWPLFAAAAVLIAGGVGAGVMLGDREAGGEASSEQAARAAGAIEPAAASARTSAATEVPASPERPVGERDPAEDATITLRIETDPPGADLLLDGEPRGATPAALTVRRGDAPMTLVLRRDGYRDETRTVIPRESQLLELHLTELPRRVRARRSSPASKMDRSFRRFD